MPLPLEFWSNNAEDTTVQHRDDGLVPFTLARQRGEVVTSSGPFEGRLSPHAGRNPFLNECINPSHVVSTIGWTGTTRVTPSTMSPNPTAAMGRIAAPTTLNYATMAFTGLTPNTTHVVLTRFKMGNHSGRIRFMYNTTYHTGAGVTFTANQQKDIFGSFTSLPDGTMTLKFELSEAPVGGEVFFDAVGVFPVSGVSLPSFFALDGSLTSTATSWLGAPHESKMIRHGLLRQITYPAEDITDEGSMLTWAYIRTNLKTTVPYTPLCIDMLIGEEEGEYMFVDIWYEPSTRKFWLDQGSDSGGYPPSFDTGLTLTTGWHMFYLEWHNGSGVGCSIDEGPLYVSPTPLTWAAPNEHTFVTSYGMGGWLFGDDDLAQGPYARFDRRLTAQERAYYMNQANWTMESFDQEEYPQAIGRFIRERAGPTTSTPTNNSPLLIVTG